MSALLLVSDRSCRYSCSSPSINLGIFSFIWFKTCTESSSCSVINGRRRSWSERISREAVHLSDMWVHGSVWYLLSFLEKSSLSFNFDTSLLNGERITTDANPCRSHTGVLLAMGPFWNPSSGMLRGLAVRISCWKTSAVPFSKRTSSSTLRISSSMMLYFSQRFLMTVSWALANSCSSSSHSWTNWWIRFEMLLKISSSVSAHVASESGTSAGDHSQNRVDVPVALK